MTKTWIQTLTLALALTGCSSSESSDKDDNEPSGRDAGGNIKHDASPTKEDTDNVSEEEKDPPTAQTDDDEDEPRDPGGKDAGSSVDAAKQDLQDASRDEVDTGSRGGKKADPRCLPSSDPFDPSVTQADTDIVGDDWFANSDGTIFTTAGAVYNVPGKGDTVFGRQQADSCVVTVAESGVMTTIYGGGTVCHNNQVVSLGIKCQTDANGDPIKP